MFSFWKKVFTVYLLAGVTLAVLSLEETKQNKESKSKSRHMITKEHLARMNGHNENKTIWIAMMSEIYDVSSAPHFYANGSTYHIFAGRDANVPFITGIFTEEEASKSITTLDDHNLYLLETFLNDTYKPEKPKYPFVGYLIGDLYTEDGKKTDLLRSIQKTIKKVKRRQDEEEIRNNELRKQYMKEIEQQEQDGKVEVGEDGSSSEL